MRNLIYYPSFEPESETWLKYALLYFDEFSPIIPPKGEKEVSDIFRQVTYETNLVKIVKPEYSDGYDAATKAIQEIDLILKRKSSYKDIFKDGNAATTWTNKNNWTAVLYREKFNDDFSDFCVSSGFGTPHSKGLLLSPELCSVYMTFLAESIAYRKQATPITDNLLLDSLSTYLRTKDITKGEMIKSAQIVVDTKLPTHIDNISLEQIINFRNQDGISELRKSFNSSLENFYSAVENNFDPISYVQSIEKTNAEFVMEMGKFLGELSIAALGALLVLSEKGTSNLEVIKQAGEAILTIAGVYGVNKSWKLSDERRNARKFLSKIRKI